jgi:hypothetical protein
MKLLKRLKVLGSTVSILESQNEIDIEIHPDSHADRKPFLARYIQEEGILDEILSGNPDWEHNPPEGMPPVSLGEPQNETP